MNAKKPDVDQVAEKLGMKPSEVLEVTLGADGVLAQTKDEKWQLIRDDGVLVCNVPGPDAEQAPADAAAKPAPKTATKP